LRIREREREEWMYEKKRDRMKINPLIGNNDKKD
jgi:hypothetical protein